MATLRLISVPVPPGAIPGIAVTPVAAPAPPHTAAAPSATSTLW